jgi:GWxTD domain-containing protein
MATKQNGRLFLLAALSCGLVAVPTARLRAQQAGTPPAQDQQAAPAANADQDQEADPLHRQLSDKDKFAARKALRQELKGAYKSWLNQDVDYIITEEERKAFRNLSNDEERDAFIEAFWQRRNPDPDSPDNAFREEHYRRIAYANEHFNAGKPGWKTDRGHIYIVFGPPDEIEDHPGGMYMKTPEEGGGATDSYPFQLWRYRHIEGIGDDVQMEFVDNCQCNDYHYSLDPSSKDAMYQAPVGLGYTTREDRTENRNPGHFKYDLDHRNSDPGGPSDLTGAKNFQRIEQYTKLFAPPTVKYADLDTFITEHKILDGPVFPFDVRTDFVRVTDSTDLVPITIQIKNKDITFVSKDGVSTGEVEIEGRVTTLTHRVVQTFEDPVQVQQPSELLGKSMDKKSVYWKALPLTPGLYRLDIAIKDVNNPDHLGLYGRGIEVPTYRDDKLGASTLILADQMNEVSSHEIGGGSFVIGNTFIRPRVSDAPATPVTFNRTQQLSFWMQIYNLGIDDATKMNNATLTYQIVDQATGTTILTKEISSKDLGPHSDELTFEKTLPIAGLVPGKYKVTITVNDSVSKQEIAQSAPFVVE